MLILSMLNFFCIWKIFSFSCIICTATQSKINNKKNSNNEKYIHIIIIIKSFEPERAVSCECCNLIGYWSGLYFPISDHGHGNQMLFYLASEDAKVWVKSLLTQWRLENFRDTQILISGFNMRAFPLLFVWLNKWFNKFCFELLYICS